MKNQLLIWWVLFAVAMWALGCVAYKHAAEATMGMLDSSIQCSQEKIDILQAMQADNVQRLNDFESQYNDLKNNYDRMLPLHTDKTGKNPGLRVGGVVHDGDYTYLYSSKSGEVRCEEMKALQTEIAKLRREIARRKRK